MSDEKKKTGVGGQLLRILAIAIAVFLVMSIISVRADRKASGYYGYEAPAAQQQPRQAEYGWPPEAYQEPPGSGMMDGYVQPAPRSKTIQPVDDVRLKLEAEIKRLHEENEKLKRWNGY